MLSPEKAALVQPMSPKSSPSAGAVEIDGYPEYMDISGGASQVESSKMVVDIADVD